MKEQKLKILSISFILIIMISISINAQNIENHLWKNRVLLVISNKPDSDTMISQLNEFEIKGKEFLERKLIVYKVTPETYKLLGDKSDKWVNSSYLFEKFNPENKPFKIVLVGLDGGVKLMQQHLLKTDELFSTIDAMPMRRAEMRKNKG